MKPFKYLPKALQTLLLANAAVFIIAFLGRGLEINLGAGYGSLTDYISYYGAFMPRVPLELWRYVTYMFIHFDFMHFFFNMLMLWMFGSEVADMMGTKHFTGMYFFCGIFAAVFSLAMYWLGMTNAPIIGASGALMGIFVAYYKFFPNRMLLMFFFFPMRIKYAMWFMVAVDVFMAHSSDGIAHFAHLGGVVGGFLYMYFYERGFGNLGKAFAKMRGPKFTVHPGGRSESESRKESSREPDDAIEGEVFYVDENKRMDEILAKVNREGINSLNETERQFLLKASEKLRRRRGGF